MELRPDFRARLQNEESQIADALDGALAHSWVSLPCVVTRYQPEKLTVDAQPTILGRVTDEMGNVKSVEMPVLLDVPVVFPHAGGCSLTFPIKAGDECLVVFADRCIDAWWRDGGIQPPLSARMHDLSDGFAICGVWSQKTKISNPSTARVELRSDDHQALVSIHPTSHEVTLETVGDVKATVGGSSSVSISGNATINVGGNATVTCPNVQVNASGSMTFDTPVLTVTGLIVGQGGLAISGGSGASVTGSLTTTGGLHADGDVTAGGISLTGHTHAGAHGETSSAH